MIGSIAVLVPSRGRPRNAVALIEAWAATSDGVADLIVAIDDDDPTVDDYPSTDLPPWVQVVRGPRRRLGGTLNQLAPDLAKAYDIVGFMGDDHRPRTNAWDAAVEAEMRPGGVVYGDDLIQHSNLPTAVFLDSRIVRALGWMVVPGMTHLFLDNLWKTLGEQLGTLTYLPHIVIEHVHPIAGKAEWDDGYAQANADDVWENDAGIYRRWTVTQMSDDIAKIRAAL